MERTLDQILAYHCAPALAGLKPSNLVSLSREEFPDLEERLEEYRQLFAPRGVAFRTMCGCGRNVLLLVYRPAELERALRTPLSAALLKKDGYDAGEDLAAMLDRLSQRLRVEGDFPHEIGLFLGYPPEDVDGFIHRKADAKCTGCWKVYGNVETAKRVFALYKKCTAIYLKQYATGKNMERLTVAV